MPERNPPSYGVWLDPPPGEAGLKSFKKIRKDFNSFVFNPRRGKFNVGVENALKAVARLLDNAIKTQEDYFENDEIRVKISPADLGTILAALRCYQSYQGWQIPAFAELASDGDSIQPLDPRNIDDLCERLNNGE